MIKIYYILAFMLGSFLLTSCFDEDPIHAELEHGKRTYDMTSSDPVIKYISEYYFKYDKEIIFDPDTADYVFNFQEKNDLRLVQLDKSRWEEGLEWLKVNFLNYYTPETIKKSFPQSLIVADTVHYLNWSSFVAKDLYVSRNMIAFAFDKGKKNLTGTAKKNLVMSYHTNFINFCITYERIVIGNQFYEIGSKKYGQYEYGKQYTQEEAYVAGFVKVSVGKSFWTDEEYTYFPSQADDFSNFLNFLLTGEEDEITRVINTHSAMKIKYDALVSALESGGINYKMLRDIMLVE